MRKQAIKSVFTLTIIAVILSGILAILNSVLFVTPEERTMRAIKKIYKEEKEITAELKIEESFDSEFGEILTIYKIAGENGDYDLLFKSKGEHGYKGGSITCWIQVKVSSGSKSSEKIVVEAYDKQTLMSKVTSAFWGEMCVDITDDYKEWFYSNPKDSDFTAKYPDAKLNPISNATKSATAGANAVNCVIEYVNEYNLGGNP